MTHRTSTIRRFSRASLLILGLVVLLAGGCHVPARIFWSPDGSRAVYINYGEVTVIDADGQIQYQAEGEGSAAWSSDGQTAYFALSTDAVPDAPLEPTVYQTGWAPPARISQDTPNEEAVVVVAHTADGIQPLFVINQAVMHLHISPDDNWLAAVTAADVAGQGNTVMSLYAWHLPSKQLFLVQRNAGFAAAFTGNSRLAFVIPADPDFPVEHQIGKLVEVVLDRDAQELNRQPLLDVMAGMTAWIQPLGNDILFSTPHRELPAQPLDVDNVADNPFRIYRYHRGDARIEVFAGQAGGLFTVSPNGQRVLFERIIPTGAGTPPMREVMIINADRTQPRVLRDITSHGMTLPMWPNWRGNDQIAFTPAPADDDPVDPTDPQWRRSDVILYDLVDEGEVPLHAVKTLSSNWDIDLKPRYRATE